MSHRARRRRRLGALCLALLLAAPARIAAAHDWQELDPALARIELLRASLDALAELQQTSVASGEVSPLEPDPLAVDWLRWLTGAADLDTRLGQEALVQSLQRRGMPGAAGGADGSRVLRSAMDRLAVAYDAAHGGLSERSEQETLDALGALDLKSSDLRVHRQAERLSYAISLRMVSPDEISAMRPFFGELEALLREAQGTPP